MSTAPIRDPEHLRSHLHRLRTVLAIASESSDSLHRTMSQTRWQGNTANQVRNGIRFTRTDLTNIAQDISAAITQIERHIAWAEDQRRELALLERRVRAWIAANPAGSGEATGRPDASIVGPLPPSHSPDWRAVVVRLRRAGVAI